MTAQGAAPPNLPTPGNSASPKNMGQLSRPSLPPPPLRMPIRPAGGAVRPVSDGPIRPAGGQPGGGVDAPDPFSTSPPGPPPSAPASLPGDNGPVSLPDSAEAAPLAPSAFQDSDGPRSGRRRLVLLLGGIVILLLLGVVGFVVARVLLTRGAGETAENQPADTGGVFPAGDDEALFATPGAQADQQVPLSGDNEPARQEDTADSTAAVLDDDNDGLTAAEERFYGTDPAVADSDRDTFTDGQEVRAGYDPLGPGKLDSDNDGFPDPDEREFGSDPFNPDTDGDGYSDGDEIANGYNPLIPSPGDKL